MSVHPIPTINIYSIVYNESFMLPHFLKHYSKWANKIFIIDDHSTDLTPQIAKAHPMVKYVKYPYEEGLDEEKFSILLAEFPKAYPSDWAVCVDGDEFIHGLETLKDEVSGVLKTKGYMMIGKTGKLEDCKKVRARSFDKPVVFDPKLDVKFGDGRHSATPASRYSKLELWHYKYPSREYYLKRNTETYPRIMDKKTMDYRLKRGLDYYDKHA